VFSFDYALSAFRSYETGKAFGKSISNEGIGIFQVDQGKVTRAWLITDRLGFLQEIGQRWPLPSWPLTSHSDRSYTFNTAVSESVARSCRRGPLTREGESQNGPENDDFRPVFYCSLGWRWLPDDGRRTPFGHTLGHTPGRRQRVPYGHTSCYFL
jgi:hypothetical protein